MVKDAVALKDVVSSVIPINSINAYVLFDFGATCLFVLHEFANRLNLPCEPLESPLNIEVANKEIIFIRHVYKNYCVDIREHKFMVDLIPTQLGEFDMILGMDLLNNYEALIHCHRKCVNLRIPNWAKVVS